MTKEQIRKYYAHGIEAKTISLLEENEDLLSISPHIIAVARKK